MIMQDDSYIKSKYNKGLVNKIALMLIMVMFLQIVVVGICQLANFFLGTEYIKFYYIMTILALSISLTIPFIILLNIIKIPIKDVIKFKPVKMNIIVPMIFIGILVCFCGVIVSAGIKFILEWFGIKSVTPDLPIADNLLDIIIQTFTIAVIPAIFEEFAFRGAILGVLRKIDDRFAIFVSAFLFGIGHGNLEQAPFAFVLGLFLGFLVIKTNSLLPGMLIHFINNLLASFLMIFKDSSNIYFQITAVFQVLFVLIGAAALFSKTNREFLSFNMIENKLNFEEKTRALFLNVGMPVYLIIICLLTFSGMKYV